MNDLDADRRRALDKELQWLEESAFRSAQSQFEQSRQWRSVNFVLGVPASILAAISGVAALVSTENSLWAGILGIAAAGFGAVLTTVNASHRTNQAASAANTYLEIQTVARQTRLLDLPTAEVDEMRIALAEITARRDEQNRTVEVPNRWARKRAQKNIVVYGQVPADSASETESVRALEAI